MSKHPCRRLRAPSGAPEKRFSAACGAGARRTSGGRVRVHCTCTPAAPPQTNAQQCAHRRQLRSATIQIDTPQPQTF